MKKNKFILLLPTILGMFLSSCGGTNPPETSEPNKDFVNVTFADKTVTYNGEPHILDEVVGAPSGTTITYTGREEYTNVGSYQATAKLSLEGYNDKSLSATLTISRADFTSYTYDSVSVEYDGLEHINDVHLVGELPAGTSIDETITNSVGEEVTTAIEVGEYNYECVLTNSNYNTVTLNATLTITRADFAGYTYDSVSVYYDGLEHINDVHLVGELPAGTSIDETITNSVGEEVTTAIEVGEYNYECVLTNPNYNTVTLNATLEIKGIKSDMPVYVNNGVVYFANGLHESFVYSYDSSNATEPLTFLDYSSPKEFIKTSDNVIYIAKTIFNSAVKELNTTGTEPSVDVLYTEAGIDDFVKLSDSIYYYSCNPLLGDAGIYKVDNTDTSNEPIVTKVFSGKTDNLSIYKNNLFFSNKAADGHLYKMDTTNHNASLVLEEKVHEYVIYDNKLYCTVNGLLNDYIGYVDLTSSTVSATKLTNAAGEFLTVRGGYLYYNYTDLFSHVDAENKGIWRINLLTKNVSQVLATENINGFDVDGDSIYYIDTNDLHLYEYNMERKTTVDLLDDFQIRETVPLNLGGETVCLGSKTYFLNMYAGKTLYVYDEITNRSSQLTTNKVEDFYIYNGILYFNQVTLFTNNDIYSVDLVNGGEAVKLSSNDMRNMVSDGEYLYATHYNWAGVAGGLSRMKLDGSEYIKFSEVNNAKNLRIRDGVLYFIHGLDNGDIETISLETITPTSQDIEGTVLSEDISNVKQFEFEGTKIIYSYDGWTDNSIRVTDFETLDEGTKIASKNTNPAEFVVYDGNVYYFSYAVTALPYAGFYKVSTSATEDETQELILACDNTYYGSSLAVSETGNFYFLNYRPDLLLGDAHFYQMNLSNSQVKKIA